MAGDTIPNGQPDPTPPNGERKRTHILDSGADVVLSFDAPNLEIYDGLAISELIDPKDAPPPPS